MINCKACQKEMSLDDFDMGYKEVCNECYNYIAHDEYPAETSCRRCGLDIEYTCPCGEKL